MAKPEDAPKAMDKDEQAKAYQRQLEDLVRQGKAYSVAHANARLRAGYYDAKK